jgi:hypothetical protein
VIIDTVAPAAPPAAPDLLAASDSGISNTDNLTNDNTPALSVTGTELIRVLDGTTVVADYAAAGNIVLSTLTDGAHSLTARSVDVAGNESAPTSALSVTIDTLAPAAPAVAPNLDAASDTGLSSTDNITNDSTPTFAGSVTPNDIVRLFVGITQASSDTTTGGGTYSIIPGVLSNGGHAITTRFEDLAGNLSGTSPTLNVTIDTVAPAAPTAAPDMLASSDSGISSTDNLTNDTTPSFTGSRPTNTIVRLFDETSHVELGADISLVSGTYDITSTARPDGQTNVQAVFEDVAGNRSAASEVIKVFIDTVAPAVNNQSFDRLTSHKVIFTFSESVSNTLTITDLSVQNLTTGTAVPAAAMQMGYLGATNTATFSFLGLPNGLLSDGEYQATIGAGLVTDRAGNALPATQLDFFVLGGDASGDGIVDITDLGILASNWQQSPRNASQGDFNNDGVVDITDLGILASNWQDSFAPRPAPTFPASGRQLSKALKVLGAEGAPTDVLG